MSDEWERPYFAPEHSDPVNIFATGQVLHATVGVSITPLRATLEQVRARNPSVVIFRRGAVDAELMAACTNLKLVQRIGGLIAGGVFQPHTVVWCPLASSRLYLC